MADQNPITPVIDDINRQWLEKAKQVQGRIHALMVQGFPVDSAVSKALDEAGMVKFITREMVQGVKNVITLGGMEVSAAPLVADKFILGAYWSPDRTKLSTKITSMTGATIIKAEMRDALQKNNSWRTAADRLYKAAPITGDVTQRLDKLVQLSKAALGGDAAAKQQYAKLIRSTEKYISKLAENEAPNLAVKAAYRKVVDATRTASTAAMDKALTRAVQEKALYNAERIARTELAIVYGQAMEASFANDMNIDGVQWELSSRHLRRDICDINAEADLWGGGKGIYPKNKIPQFPAHPHCLCILSPVYLDKPLTVKENPEEKKKILKKEKAQKIKPPTPTPAPVQPLTQIVKPPAPTSVSS